MKERKSTEQSAVDCAIRVALDTNVQRNAETRNYYSVAEYFDIIKKK